MIQRLGERGITDERVLRAMLNVPRHVFLPPGLEHQAYDEKALPIGFGQTISHPYTVAMMTQALNVKKNDRILEIGTGSGYQAAVLCEMKAQVFSVERIKAIGEKARQKLDQFRYHCLTKIGDGSLGWQQHSPYDAIIVTAGAPVMPDNLFGQLKEEGMLLIPVGTREEQTLTMYIKTDNEITKTELEKLKFVPLCGKKGW